VATGQAGACRRTPFSPGYMLAPVDLAAAQTYAVPQPCPAPAAVNPQRLVFNAAVSGGKYSPRDLSEALGAIRVTPKVVWSKLGKVRG